MKKKSKRSYILGRREYQGSQSGLALVGSEHISSELSQCTTYEISNWEENEHNLRQSNMTVSFGVLLTKKIYE